jgi:hypothetical protein
VAFPFPARHGSNPSNQVTNEQIFQDGAPPNLRHFGARLGRKGNYEFCGVTVPAG